MVDTVLEDGGDIFRVGGRKSVLIKSSNHGDASSMLLILSNSEGSVYMSHLFSIVGLGGIATLVLDTLYGKTAILLFIADFTKPCG